mmetsp:Transcript_76396/g.199115  ORF Transcript_76396/g.199115 Transcript_76396/m.199115 type:complete len:208 (-) Transcript_76396:463-1086(-)
MPNDRQAVRHGVNPAAPVAMQQKGIFALLRGLHAARADGLGKHSAGQRHDDGVVLKRQLRLQVTHRDLVMISIGTCPDTAALQKRHVNAHCLCKGCAEERSHRRLPGPSVQARKRELRARRNEGLHVWLAAGHHEVHSPDLRHVFVHHLLHRRICKKVQSCQQVRLHLRPLGVRGVPGEVCDTNLHRVHARFHQGCMARGQRRSANL